MKNIYAFFGPKFFNPGVYSTTNEVIVLLSKQSFFLENNVFKFVTAVSDKTKTYLVFFDIYNSFGYSESNIFQFSIIKYLLYNSYKNCLEYKYCIYVRRDLS